MIFDIKYLVYMYIVYNLNFYHYFKAQIQMTALTFLLVSTFNTILHV